MKVDGYYIEFAGIAGVGKSTLVKALVESDNLSFHHSRLSHIPKWQLCLIDLSMLLKTYQFLRHCKFSSKIVFYQKLNGLYWAQRKIKVDRKRHHLILADHGVFQTLRGVKRVSSNFYNAWLKYYHKLHLPNHLIVLKANKAVIAKRIF